MNPNNLPLLGSVLEFGAQDRVLDTILLLGPVVLLAMVLLGRTTLTTALVASYVAVFAIYAIYNGYRS